MASQRSSRLLLMLNLEIETDERYKMAHNCSIAVDPYLRPRLTKGLSLVSTTLPAAEASAPFSASAVTQVVKKLLQTTQAATREKWLSAVAQRTVSRRPDLSPALQRVLGTAPAGEDVLAGLSIGEIGVCYEALLAALDRGQRRTSGQYFTPDDAAAFMAGHARDFPNGRWLDPCCGVGNLSWHLAAAQASPADFVRDRLILIDRDETALKTALAIIGADFAAESDNDAIHSLHERSMVRDFLSPSPLPAFDFAILNPPYARAPEKPGYRTRETRDLFAYFLERVIASAKGFIAVTPASFLSIPKFQPLRDCFEKATGGGKVFVFDNVPDTLFRGYKFGSSNTSKTNFVRAAVTVASPIGTGWQVTPILRWSAASRPEMFARCHEFLTPRRIGPNGEWAKIAPAFEEFWKAMSKAPARLSDLAVAEQTAFSLTVATTPRYYISASFRPLNRRSKAVLHFRTEADRERAAIVLNSSLPYLWWRILDGGVTLPRRVLMSVPLPQLPEAQSTLIDEIKESEHASVVTKLNAGRLNENVKHPKELVAKLNDVVIPAVAAQLDVAYSQDMFTHP